MISRETVIRAIRSIFSGRCATARWTISAPTPATWSPRSDVARRLYPRYYDPVGAGHRMEAVNVMCEEILAASHAV